MLAYTSWNSSPSVEASDFNFCIVESTEAYDSPSDSPPAMTQASPSIKSEMPQQSPEVRTLPDSGLGIITQGDIYGTAFNSTTEQENMSVYTSSGFPHDRGKLASPFAEPLYASVPVCAYPQTTISDAGSSAFHTPAQQFLSPQGSYPSMQYSMSPASYTPQMPQHLSIQQDLFGHPARSSSAHSTPGQISNWTPQNAVSWQMYPPPVFTHSPAFAMDQCQDQWCNSACLPYTAMTVPVRRKPHLRPSLSESMVPRMSTPARLRAASTGHYLQPPQYNVQQLPLPPLPQNILFDTSPNIVLSDSPRRSHRSSRSASSTPNRGKRPISPPASDFVTTSAPYLIPVKQDPAFQGDLYTPKYKRRAANGRWEGWCGYCSPGRWLDLKNSRYWEDKLRNHGICAKTKMRFEKPVEIRKINPDGSVVATTELHSDLGDPFSDQKKREGLCGTCNTWVTMDGLRTKARDRAVGWWMHAYKCHDHDKSQLSTTSSTFVAKCEEQGIEHI